MQFDNLAHSIEQGRDDPPASNKAERDPNRGKPRISCASNPKPVDELGQKDRLHGHESDAAKRAYDRSTYLPSETYPQKAREKSHRCCGKPRPLQIAVMKWRETRKRNR